MVKRARERRAHTGRWGLSLWLVCMCATLPASLGVPNVQAQSQGPRLVIGGFEVSGRFLEEWSKHGSIERNVYINGLPITERRSEISTEDGRAYDTQWFERARYELHPLNPRPHDVLLGRLGALDVEGRGKVDPSTGRAANPGDEPFVGIERPSDADGTAKLWFPETRHTLSGKLLEYWWRYGGLSQFGYPLSEPFEETSRADGKRYMVQYFERARMELHPEKPAPYEVELGLLGVEQVEMRAVPSEEVPVAPTRGVRTTKESITIGSTQEPGDLTIFNNAAISARIQSLIHDGLVGRDDNGNLFPLVAWYVPTLENGGARFVGTGEDRHLQVKYKLRQGIKWSDGQEVTSEDAIFAYKLILDPSAPVISREEYRRLQNVDNPDRHTVVYRYLSLRQARDYLSRVPDPENYEFLKPFVDLNKPVVSPVYSEVGSILPEHVLSRMRADEIVESPYARAPVGTGPWKVERWRQGQEMAFVPNEHYTLTVAPAIKRIQLTFITDVLQLEARAMRGEVDLILSEAYVVPPEQSDIIRAAGVIVASRPGAIWEHLDFSFHYGPFKERAVREAIITAINRQQIVDVVYKGTAKVANGVVPEASPYSLERKDYAVTYPEIASRYKLPIYPYDPNRASQLLEDAGWKLGPDGIRAKNGEKLKFVYATIINRIRQQIQQLVSTDLRAVGIQADVRACSANIHAPPNCRSLIPLGDAAMVQFAWVTPADAAFDQWTCADIWNPTTGGQNLQHYCNPGLDAANTRLKTDIGLEARLASAEAQVILMQDIAVIPLVERPIIELVSARLQNYKLANGISGEHTYPTSFWNARQWYFANP